MWSSPQLLKLEQLVISLQIWHIDRIPISHSQWEIKETKKIFQYLLTILQPGSFFGHEELYSDKNRMYEAKTVGLRSKDFY